MPYRRASGTNVHGQHGLLVTQGIPSKKQFTPTSCNSANEAFSAQPGRSFASGLGSVNATHLLTAWRKFIACRPRHR